MSNLNLKQGKVAAESGDGGGGEPLGLMRGLRSRMAPLLFLITVLSSCSAVGYKPHHVDNTLRTLRTRALAQLGVEDEGVQVSSEYVDYDLKPLRLAVGCEGGDKGFVEGPARLKALAIAKAAGFPVDEIEPIVASETSLSEHGVTCVGHPESEPAGEETCRRDEPCESDDEKALRSALGRIF